MTYTIIKEGTVLFSGIYEPNLMSFKNTKAIYTVKNDSGVLLLSQEL